MGDGRGVRWCGGNGASCSRFRRLRGSRRRVTADRPQIGGGTDAACAPRVPRWRGARAHAGRATATADALPRSHRAALPHEPPAVVTGWAVLESESRSRHWDEDDVGGRPRHCSGTGRSNVRSGQRSDADATRTRSRREVDAARTHRRGPAARRRVRRRTARPAGQPSRSRGRPRPCGRGPA